mgnify:CR=1 FL=1
MSERDLDAIARDQTIDILRRSAANGGFDGGSVKELKAALVEHIQAGGDLDYGLSIVNPSLSTFAPSIRLTLSLEMPKEAK